MHKVYTKTFSRYVSECAETFLLDAPVIPGTITFTIDGEGYVIEDDYALVDYDRGVVVLEWAHTTPQDVTIEFKYECDIVEKTPIYIETLQFGYDEAYRIINHYKEKNQ